MLNSLDFLNQSRKKIADLITHEVPEVSVTNRTYGAYGTPETNLAKHNHIWKTSEKNNSKRL